MSVTMYWVKQDPKGCDHNWGTIEDYSPHSDGYVIHCTKCQLLLDPDLLIDALSILDITGWHLVESKEEQ